jgi:hypothetical protein
MTWEFTYDDDTISLKTGVFGGYEGEASVTLSGDVDDVIDLVVVVVSANYPPCDWAYACVSFTPLVPGYFKWTVVAGASGTSSCSGAFSDSKTLTSFLIVRDSGPAGDKAEITTHGPTVFKEGKLYTTEDEKKKLGTIVVREFDDVYSDAKEPAKRRKIELTAPLKTVTLTRGSKYTDKDKDKKEKFDKNLKLFKTETGGDELFKDKNKIELEKGTYWLQGGELASLEARDQYLKVGLKDGPIFDQLNVTVLWVQVAALATPEYKLPGPKKLVELMKGEAEKTEKEAEQTKLGMSRLVGGSRLVGWTYIYGYLSPQDLETLKFGEGPFTKGFSRPDKPPKEASVDFGFLFRRTITGKLYNNGQKEPVLTLKDEMDDSFERFQAYEPFKLEGVHIADLDLK